eukprot:scaffold66956_cov63-Phaeocystis_antarctica.AAC.4
MARACAARRYAAVPARSVRAPSAAARRAWQRGSGSASRRARCAPKSHSRSHYWRRGSAPRRGSALAQSTLSRRRRPVRCRAPPAPPPARPAPPAAVWAAALYWAAARASVSCRPVPRARWCPWRRRSFALKRSPPYGEVGGGGSSNRRGSSSRPPDAPPRRALPHRAPQAAAPACTPASAARVWSPWMCWGSTCVEFRAAGEARYPLQMSHPSLPAAAGRI